LRAGYPNEATLPKYSYAPTPPARCDGSLSVSRMSHEIVCQGASSQPGVQVFCQTEIALQAARDLMIALRTDRRRTSLRGLVLTVHESRNIVATEESLGGLRLSCQWIKLMQNIGRSASR
jgi:hypothetical protein